MSKELCISSTPHETRLAIVEDDQLTEIYYERENEYTLAGSIYKGRVTRVLPGMQSAFVDIGLERDAFLYVTDFLEEAGEAADFEKPQAQAGNGGGGGRGRQREPRAPREAVDNGRIQVESIAIADEPAQPAAVRAPRAAAPVASVPGAAPAASPEEEFDHGTRRWRGRRGRRRGFRGGQREGAGTAQSAAPIADEGLAENYHDEPEAPFEAVAGLPFSAAAESAPAPRSSFSSTPAHSRQVHQESAGSTKPIILPGESLSKYGHQPAATTGAAAPAAQPTKPQPAITSRPSTIVEGPLAWDGVSAALPGESLSKYKNRPSQPVVAAEPVAEPVFAEPSFPEASFTDEHGGSEHQIEDHSAPAAPVAEDLHSASHSEPIEILHAVHTPEGVSFEEVEPAHSAPPAIEEAPVSFTAQHPAPLELEEQEGASFVEAPVAPIEASADVHAPQAHPESEAGHEYEPENASASYRVPPPASEFRLASFFGFKTEEEKAAKAETHAAETPAAVVAEPVEHVEEVHHFSEHDSHDVANGHSEAHLPSSHEAAYDVPQAEAGPDTEPGSPVEHLHAFAPGHGLLEEEVIDEDEYDFTPLHGHADDHDLEEIEEETVDNDGAGNTMVGSQLGDLVRDEHIQRRVMGDPEDEDELDESESDSDEEEIDEADEAHARAESAAGGFTEEDFLTESAESEIHSAAANAGTVPAPRRDDSRRDGRGDGRNNQRGGRRGNGQRGRNGGGGHRHSAQTSDLPIISDLLKQGQEVLVQIAKEPIAKKGARITSHIALPGRFLVFMPTVNHVGVSRKISSDEERYRLKQILTSEKGSAPGGFIVRTAADGASEEELRADLRFLISLWTEIKQRSDTGKSPALIYHDLNLVERILRDQVSDNFSTIWVDSETEYERIVRFLNRFEPSLVRRVKLYTKETPLFEQFGIQEEISKALKSKVWLKSGGSIVINQTEALVAIDINTGKYVGKTARLEDTIVKTNLDAIPEIVRQIRLRDLGGIIIIDFIDMDERKNRNRVMQALEEALKADRAPSKVLQFNDFGLVAITRKRVKQSLERTLSTQCEICAGTGMVKSPITVCNEIYTELRKMQKHFERGDVLLRVHPEIVKALKANNGKWLSELEEMIGRTIIVKSDPALHPEQFDIH
jgi:ribonuclease G